MYVEGDSGSARPWAEEGPQRGSSRWKTPWWASLGVPRWGSTKQLFWTLQAPCLVSPGLSSLRLRFRPPGRHPHLLSSPSLLGCPSPSGLCSVPRPVSWGLWPGLGRAGGSGIPKGLRLGRTRRIGSNGRLVCVTWGPGWQIIKAGNA